MNFSIAVLVAVLMVLLVVALVQGGPKLASNGIATGLGLFVQVAPQLLLGFALAGLVTVLLPSEILGRYVGADSGMSGVLVATFAGVATPGGPFVQFPLVAALAKAGAAPGPLAAYLTAWSLIAWHRVLVWELPLMGAQFTASRWIVSLVAPILIGLIVPHVIRLMPK